jgi:NAD(P)-dependent dehydrogenase (short-subunit alcohol dehydrogenase family)
MKNTAAKTALVTGAGQGIGKAIASAFLEDGMNVVLFDADNAALKKTAGEFQVRGDVLAVRGDNGKESDVRRAVAAALKRFGRLDVLVNNAGIISNKSIEKLRLAEWNRVISTNLTGAFLFTKYAAPYLKKSRGGIINIASTRALMSEPDTEPYSASKGGIVALTHALAISLGPNVRVNCISPGWIDTKNSKLSKRDHEQHPAGRVGLPDDIARLAVFLADPRNSFITGQNFTADGGMTRKMIYA